MIWVLANAFLGTGALSGIFSAICSENASNMIFVLISEMNSRRLLLIEVINDFLVTGSTRMVISTESMTAGGSAGMTESVLMVSSINPPTLFLMAAVAPAG